MIKQIQLMIIKMIFIQIVYIEKYTLLKKRQRKEKIETTAIGKSIKETIENERPHEYIFLSEK